MERHNAPKDISSMSVKFRYLVGLLTEDASQSKDRGEIDEDRIEGNLVFKRTSRAERRRDRSGGAPSAQGTTLISINECRLFGEGVDDQHR